MGDGWRRLTATITGAAPVTFPLVTAPSRPPVHRFVRGLRSLRRWTTVGQSAERHPTARPRRWQAFFFRVQRPGVRSGPAIAVTTRFRARSRTFFPRLPGGRSRKIRSQPNAGPTGRCSHGSSSSEAGNAPQPRAAWTRSEPGEGEFGSGQIRSKPATSRREKTCQPSLQRSLGLPTNF